MKNKSQITLYVILGILLLIVLGSIYYFASLSSKIQSPDIREKISSDYLTLRLDDCIETLIIQSIDDYGLCDTELKFQQKINQEIASCMDFPKYELDGYIVKVRSRPNKVQVDITKDEIFTYIEYPMEFSKEKSLIKFDKGEYTFQRRKSITFDSVTLRDHILISPDLDFELTILKDTRVSTKGRPLTEIEVYIKELCPDDPTALGRVKYEVSPDTIEFSPEAFLAIRYEDKDVSRLAKERSFKLAFLDKNHWEFIQSSADVEDNKVIASIPHLSDWIATCDGSVKHGMQVMFQDLVVDDFSEFIVDRDLACAYNFSGSCGYVKLIVYLNELQGNLKHYEVAVNKIYDNELIPVLTIKENRNIKNDIKEDFWPHPQKCISNEKTCMYGEDADSSNKPEYDYKKSTELLLQLLKAVHPVEIQEFPLYLEIWNEPNMAIEWNNISLTDYEISEYARYFSEIASAVKSLNQPAIKLMPAGLRPTDGQKECRVDPAYKKDVLKADELKADQHFNAEFCFNLGILHGSNSYMFTKGNLCTVGGLPAEPSNLNKDCNAECTKLNLAAPCTQSEQCEQNKIEKKRKFVKEIGSWYDMYNAKGPGNKMFAGLSGLPKNPDETYFDAAKAIRQRILDTVPVYCFEKITEVPTNEYLTKMLQAEVCDLMDLYADHSYPDMSKINEYPYGNSPLGAEAYNERFSLAGSICAKLGNLDCTPIDSGDIDDDGILDIHDNCAYNPNGPNKGTCVNDYAFNGDPCTAIDQCGYGTCQMNQEDWNYWMGTGIGDVCEDFDGDGESDAIDICPNNKDISLESDVTPDEAADPDNDGWANICDNCPDVYNRDQINYDDDKLGDVCDSQTDGDEIPNFIPENENVPVCDSSTDNCIDNCPYKDNPGQVDNDDDGIGDACDNCPPSSCNTALDCSNPGQENWNNDMEGDYCDDSDKDGIYDYQDICPDVPLQEGQTEHSPEDCQPEKLCIGNAFITQTAWGPIPDNIPLQEPNLDPDNYVNQMKESFKTWREDDNVLGIIAFNLGEEKDIVPQGWGAYGWTKEFCPDGCIGKEIFNVIGEIKNPYTSCDQLPGAECGNGKAEPGESCDDKDLNSITCADFETFESGDLSCNPPDHATAPCHFDTSKCVCPSGNCSGVCGDGTLNTGEECDTDVKDITCTDFSTYTGGTLACDAECKFDFSQCTAPPGLGGSCTVADVKVRLQNLKKDVGPCTIVYTCDKGGSTVKTEGPASGKCTTVHYEYRGIDNCFEQSFDLPNLCPDSDNTVREGIIGETITIDGNEYVAMILCEPSITTSMASVHLCGSIEQCNYDIANCYAVEGKYGDWTHCCTTFKGAGCVLDKDCAPKFCFQGNCVTCRDKNDCDPGMACLNNECV